MRSEKSFSTHFNSFPDWQWKISWLISTCFGLGLPPKGSGTVCSFFAVIFWWAVLDFTSNRYLCAGLIVAWTLVGLLAIRIFEERSQTHDSHLIVVDEWVGMGISMLLIPLELPWIVAAFFVFRFMDIVKPLGVGAIDRNLPGAPGTMLDDVLAGIYSLLVLFLVEKVGGNFSL